jgi:hypothetical protein
MDSRTEPFLTCQRRLPFADDNLGARELCSPKAGNSKGRNPVSKNDYLATPISLAPIYGLLAVLLAVAPASAQVRGLYTPGVFSTNSGVMPEPGLTYSNAFLDYTFNELHGADGQRLQTNPAFTVLADLNVFELVNKKKVLGANIGAVAMVAVTNSSISFAALGNVAGGAGFGDFFAEPIVLGWHLNRADIQAGYAFVAPTGRFVPRSTTNVGAGYWGHCPFAGETVYLTKNKALSASAFQFYEFHGTQTGTEVHPGQTMSLDYSVTQMLPLQKTTLLQFGLIGYGQWQTTDKTGPAPAQIASGMLHYGVLGLGAGANVILPARKVSLGFKYYKEFHAVNTVEGYTIQISAGITF